MVPAATVCSGTFLLRRGYKIRVTPHFDVIPSVMVKLASPSPVSVDVNLKARLCRPGLGRCFLPKRDAVSAYGWYKY